MDSKNTSRPVVLRTLGVLVGALFVVMGPLVAKDKGLSSFDGISYLVVNLAIGIVFIRYGITGSSGLGAQTPRARRAVGAMAFLLMVGVGMYLLLAPDRTTLSRIVGVVILLWVGIAILAAYATRRSNPAA